jgi:hypothetical protein
LIIWAATLLMAAATLFPPWTCVGAEGTDPTVVRHWFLAPPPPNCLAEELDIRLLLLQYAVILAVAASAFRQTVIQSRERDEKTGRRILPKKRLLDRHYYIGRSRDATVARWNASENCFYCWKEEENGWIHIATNKYPTDETEVWFDGFNVVEQLPSPKLEIPFDKQAEFRGDPNDLTEFAEQLRTPMDPRLLPKDQ